MRRPEADRFPLSHEHDRQQGNWKEVALSPTTTLVESHTNSGAQLGERGGRTIPLSFSALEDEIAATRKGAALCDLSYVTPLRIAGSDARRWSNGMFTNNVRFLPPGGGNQHGIADAKGRIQGLLDLYCVTDTEFIGLLDGREFAWFQSTFDMFIIMDDVDLEDLSNNWGVLSVQGPRAAAVLEGIGITVPDLDWAPAGQGIQVMRRDRGAGEGFDLLVDCDRIAEVWADLMDAGGTPVGDRCVEALRILGGIPRWPTDFLEKSFAHEMHIKDRICSFDKGCYRGQEVINRMETMGRVNKCLVGVTADRGVSLDGKEILVQDRSVGRVSSSVALGGHNYGLAILRVRALEDGQGEVDGVPVSITSPPFQ